MDADWAPGTPAIKIFRICSFSASPHSVEIIFHGVVEFERDFPDKMWTADTGYLIHS